MTTVLDRSSSVDERRQTPKLLTERAAAARPRWLRGAPPVLIGVLALVLRLVAITRAYEVFVDEITYATIGRNLADGAGLTLYGRPFTLHPPAAFGVYAAVIHLTGIGGSVDHVIMSLRPVSAVFGALSCVGIWFLVDRVAGRNAATIAATILALDPFTISYDSLVMLEAPAGAFSIASVALLAAAADGEPGRRRTVLLGLSGLSAGVVVTTKDTFGLVVAATILALLATGWVVRRREMLLVAGATAASYGIYLAALTGSSDIGSWWSSNVDGLLRLVGAKQETGFNAPTVHVTLVSRAFADLGATATSYLILGAGPIASMALVWHLRPWKQDWQRRATGRQRGILALAVWTVAAAGYISYATVFGSIEEQMYYILLAPALAATVTALVTIPRRTRPRAGLARRGLRRLGVSGRRRRSPEIERRRIAAILGSETHRDATPAQIWEHLLDDGVYLCSVSTMQELRAAPFEERGATRRVSRKRVLGLVLAAVLAFDATVWVHVHTTPSDGYNRFLAWESTHIPAGSTVSVTEGSAQFLLDNLILGDWDTRSALVAHRVEYVLVSKRLVTQGYTASLPFLQLLEQRGRLVYSSGQSIGLELYDVRALTGAP